MWAVVPKGVCMCSGHLGLNNILKIDDNIILDIDDDAIQDGRRAFAHLGTQPPHILLIYTTVCAIF